MPEIVIIGGGIIGLSTAWHLAGEGADVTVLEKNRIGSGASGASAGMLAPLAEADKPGAFVELGLASLRMYDRFVETLREETGAEIENLSAGMLRVAFTDEEAEALSFAGKWQRDAGLPIERLTGDQARAMEPCLSEEVRGALLSPQERQFDPRVIVDVLGHGCRARGVTIREQCPVVACFTPEPGRRQKLVSIATPSGEVACGTLVLAGGAWMEEMGDWLGVKLPVFPVKGQILALRADDAAGELEAKMSVKHTLYGGHNYIVPRGDGRLIVGATAEEVGFDLRPTVSGVASLLAAAARFAPSLAEAEIESIWCGLRPATRDHLPIIGRLPGWENVYTATGHFRNGILLAPITGKLLAEEILTGQVSPMLSSMRPERFH